MKKQYLSRGAILIVPILGVISWVPAVLAGQLLVAETGSNAITRLADLNGDGDALDLGERTLWADAVNSPRSLSFLNGAVFAVGGSAEIYRLHDDNLDGDALDAGEWSIFADGFGSPAHILALDNGRTYVSDSTPGEVWQLVDVNGDGDALDVGERSLFAVNLSGADDIIVFQGDLLVSSNVSNQVHRLTDLNGDGDALDVGENLSIANIFPGNVGRTRGLLDDMQGGFFVTSSPLGSVSHARDFNGDGDMFDVAELVLYADSFFGSLDAPGELVGLDGAILATDANLGEVVKILDLNGDGDALDIGEVVPFADGLFSPNAIVVETSIAPQSLPGDFDQDNDVDGIDFLIWQRDPSVGSLLEWELNYGTSISLEAVSDAVPEPNSLLLAGFCLLLGIRVFRSS